jgi:acyl-CoA reductase-like NAD-dependent aldehyde dehydrogenase
MTNFRESSRGNWNSRDTIEEINAGSMQRIADAAEKMAANYDELRRALESAKKSRDYWRSVADQRQRRINALRGHITRLRKKP